jgi:O-succinylbenzoic acid--CoA ligase
VLDLVREWLDQPEPEPLAVRTSGSTGEPKLVLLSAAAMRASATATAARLDGHGQWVLALPPHHVAGLQVLVRSVLAGTTPVLLDEHPDLPAATRALTHDRRLLAIVPTQLHRWLDHPPAVDALRTYRAVLVGGAGCPPRLLERAREAGMRVVTTYGMSETAGGCVYDGIALDGVGVALGAHGEIRLAGPMLMDGYQGRPDLTAQVLRDGWFHTPDLGRFDADGRLEVLGRGDDVVVSGGENVPLPAVERRMAEMPGLDQVAVVAVPDPEWGSEVVAVVSGGAGAPDLPAVRDFVAAEHPRSWAPRRLVVLEALPMLESGKPDRVALRRTAEAAR